MSGICGIVNFDGKPVDPELLRKMAEAAAYRGPDGINYWIQGNVGFAHLALHTTPESVREHQPLVNRRGDIVLTADARVDNRDELIRTLTSKGYLEEKDPTDVDLIMAAYECWGEKCAAHIIGDFAFAVWNRREEMIFAARDAVGYRSFYYRQQGTRFQWASEAKQLMVEPGFGEKLNERAVAEDLVLPGYGGRHATYYLGISKLGPAEKLTAKSLQVQRKRHWEFDPSHTLNYSDRSEYAEHFEDIFREAVRCRLRALQPIGVFLSGGLDSTSVTAMAADELIRTGQDPASKLKAVHWTFPETPKANEYNLSRAVVEQSGIGYTEVQMDPFWPLHDYPEKPPDRDEPFSSHMYSFHIASLHQVPHARVWMTGFEGDTMVGCDNPFFYWDLLRKGQLTGFLSYLSAHSRMFGVPTFYILRRFFLKPLLVQPVARRLRLLRRLLTKQKTVFASWVSPTLVDRVHLAPWILENGGAVAALNGSSDARRWSSVGKYLRYRRITYHQHTRMRAWLDRLVASESREIWSPWSDRRLAEFLLAIPEEEIAQGINHKLILRTAMRRLLPLKVREKRGLRQGPGLYIEAALRRKAYPLIASVISNSRGVSMGFFDADGFEQTFREFAHGNLNWTFSMWVALSLELWLQTHFSA